MDAALETRIQQIIDSGFETPSILKKVLADELALIKQDQQNRDILGLIFMEAQYLFNNVEGSKKFSGAHMIIATTTGLIIVEEGLGELNLEFGGYRARYVPYSKISCVEIDSCLLLGVFKLALGGTLKDPDFVIEFDTAQNFHEFDQIIKIIRSKMTAIERSILK